MRTLSLYYYDRHIADRVLIFIDHKGFRIKTEDLGLSINSLVSVKFNTNNLSSKTVLSLPAVVSDLDENTLTAKFESLNHDGRKIIDQYLGSDQENKSQGKST